MRAIYIRLENGLIEEFSGSEVTGFLKVMYDDNDIFTHPQYYTVDKGLLVVKPEFKKLNDDEYSLTNISTGGVHMTKPKFVTIDTPVFTLTPEQIDGLNTHFLAYSLVDDNLVKNDDILNDNLLNWTIQDFRNYRDEVFKKWDVLKVNSLLGLEDPITNDEKEWYLAMKDFTDVITKDTSFVDYPELPERLK